MGTMQSKTQQQTLIALINNMQNKNQQTKCKAQNCTENHPAHYCMYCKNNDSDHKSKYCDMAPAESVSTSGSNKHKCKVSDCKEGHRKHYCRVCHNKDSDHYATSCPKGINLYHGTRLDAALNIQKTGFRPSKFGRLGEGVYFTPDFEIAATIGARTKFQQQGEEYAVLQCRFCEDSEHVKKDLHPQWENQIQKISDGEFIEYVVRKQFIKRIKIVKLHKI